MINNNGGFRIFAHRHFVPATDPDSAIYIQNNAEAFVNIDYKRNNDFDRQVKTFPCWHTVHQWNLWFDLEVEIVNYKTYSREGCIHEWQAKTLFRICKCLPYHYTQVFDWWWGRWDETLRCNHHGLKCFALVNSKFLKLFQYSQESLDSSFIFFRYFISSKLYLGKLRKGHPEVLPSKMWST